MLSQSAVSAALADLEGQLSVQLFDRVGKRLVINEHGRLLYPQAVGLLEQTLEIGQLFREDNGTLRVLVSSTIGNNLLLGMIANYRRDFPALPLEIRVGNSQNVIIAVADCRVNIGLIEGPCHMAELITEPWLEDELVVFATPGAADPQPIGLIEKPQLRHGSCVSTVPARVRLSINYCCCTCRSLSWHWSWAI